MSPNFNSIKEQAIALPAEERTDLVHELLVSLDEQIDADIESEWDKEIQKRVAEIKSGKAKGRRAEDILADIRAKYSWEKLFFITMLNLSYGRLLNIMS